MIKAIYVHIPFCLRKCFYCDFPSYANRAVTEIDAYVESLVYEINSAKINVKEGVTLYFGGGTPSLLSAIQLSKIMGALRDKGWLFSEISLEANPGTVTEEKLLAFKALGINRLSFGVQTFKNSLLKTIGRIHNRSEAIQAILLAKKVGFENINIDLMNALPTQTVFDVYEDLKTALSLEPTHISAYALKVEEGTAFAELANQNEFFQPLDEIQEAMYELIPKILTANGFKRYEISNFAKSGYECEHNKVYWRYQNYYAFGLGACSFWENFRKTNTFSLETYLAAINKKAPISCTEEKLKPSERQGEYVFMNLRLTSGLNFCEYQLLFKENFLAKYGALIQKHIANGLLFYPNKETVALTNKGFKYSNIVFRDFVN